MNFTGDGSYLVTIPIKETGSYKLVATSDSSVFAPYTVEFTVKGSYVPTPEDIRPMWPEPCNPGYHITLKQTSFTLDLKDNRVARLGYKLNCIGTDPVYYADHSEDRDEKVIKFKRLVDDDPDNSYIEYEATGVGTTRLHVFVLKYPDRFDHHEVTFKVVDSGTPT